MDSFYCITQIRRRGAFHEEALCARIDSGQEGPIIIEGCQHDHRRECAAAAQLAQHLDPIHAHPHRHRRRGAISFWVVALLRKGTRLHRRLGDVYLLAMLGILLTATPMAAVAFARGRSVFGPS